MSDFTTGSKTDCLTHQHVTHPASALGADITVTEGAISAYIWLYHGFIEDANNTNPGFFSIQTKAEAAGTDEGWTEVQRITAKTIAAAGYAPCTISATEAVGQTTLSTTSGEGAANLTDGEMVYIQDTVVIDGEWHWIEQKDPTATTVELMEGLVNEKLTSDEIWPEAEAWMYVLTLAGVVEWRVVFSHRGTLGANVAVWGNYIEVTDFE